MHQALVNTNKELYFMGKTKRSTKPTGDNSDVRSGIFLPADVWQELRSMGQAKGLKLATYCRMILIEHAREPDVNRPVPPSRKHLKPV